MPTGVALSAVAGLQMDAITSSLSSEWTRSMWIFCAASAASNLILATVASVSSCTTARHMGARHEFEQLPRRRNSSTGMGRGVPQGLHKALLTVNHILVHVHESTAFRGLRELKQGLALHAVIVVFAAGTSARCSAEDSGLLRNKTGADVSRGPRDAHNGREGGPLGPRAGGAGRADLKAFAVSL